MQNTQGTFWGINKIVYNILLIGNPRIIRKIERKIKYRIVTE